MIAPNKQNLIQLNNQKKITQNGYKLLKEKRAGLIKYFLELSREGKKLEFDVSKYLKYINSSGRLFSIYDIIELNKYLFGNPSTYIHVSKKRVSGVYIDIIHIEISTSIRTKLKEIVQNKLESFSDIFPMLVKLGQLKLNCSRLAEEILKTNRQISNLEKKIEDITSITKKIRAILSDKENLEKGILMKLFI